MVEEWDSWEYLIREDIERLEYRIQQVHKSMEMLKIPQHIRNAFISGKLKQIIREVCSGEQTHHSRGAAERESYVSKRSGGQTKRASAVAGSRAVGE